MGEYPLYTGKNDCCEQCGRKFKPGQKIFVTLEGETLCFGEGPKTCFNFLVSAKNGAAVNTMIFKEKAS